MSPKGWTPCNDSFSKLVGGVVGVVLKVVCFITWDGRVIFFSTFYMAALGGRRKTFLRVLC